MQRNPRETAMANTPESRYQQRPQRTASAATGWIIGTVIAILAIAALWFYGFRSSTVTTTTSAPTSTETPAPGKEAPPATTTPGTATGGSSTSTTPAPAPAQSNP
jgi:hypothetical protein